MGPLGLERFLSFPEVLRESVLFLFPILKAMPWLIGPFSMFQARNHRVSASDIRHVEASLSLLTSEVPYNYL